MTNEIFRALYAGFYASGTISREAITIFVVLSLRNSVLVMPVIWACLYQGPTWLFVLVSILWSCILTPFELLFISLSGIGGVGHEFFVTLNLVQLTAVTLTLLCVRIAGFRLSNEMPEVRA